MDKTLGCKLHYLSRLLMSQINQAIKPHGVSQGQLTVLCCLLDEDGTTQSVLREKIQVEQPTMANTLHRMERDGLIHRVPSKEDRRQSQIFLTPKIRPTVLALQKERDHVIDRITRKMSDKEVETFHRLLDIAMQSLGNEEQNPFENEETDHE